MSLYVSSPKLESLRDAIKTKGVSEVKPISGGYAITIKDVDSQIDTIDRQAMNAIDGYKTVVSVNQQGNVFRVELE